MNPELIKLSKFLSKILRHRPEKIGIKLDASGWANIDELLAACQQHHVILTRDKLEIIVNENDKKRFIINEMENTIRAHQGHTIPVRLEYPPAIPPDYLYHGTSQKNVPSIRLQGLLKGKRHHVHLSPDETTAYQVGKRYGKPVILKINAKSMHDQGIVFYLTPNNVWLVEQVPVHHIVFPETEV